MENEAVFVNKKTGEVITTLGTLKGSSINVLGGNGNFRIPRKYAIKNITGNEEIYNQLLNYIGKTLRMESDQINVTFEIGLDGDEVILKEVIK